MKPRNATDDFSPTYAMLSIGPQQSGWTIMDTGYILVACGFVALAIAYNLWVRSRMKMYRPPSASGPRGWVTRELHRGDLHALSDAARGHYGDINIDQIGRLRGRGFLTTSLVGEWQVTLKGRLAILVRSTIAKGHFVPRDRLNS